MPTRLLSRLELTITDVRILRFAIGMTISIGIAFSINWPMSYFSCIFVAKFLGTTKPKIPLPMLAKIFMVMVVAFYFAQATIILLPYPLLFLLVMMLILFRVFYWHQNGGNSLMITMLIIGITVIPLIGMLAVKLSSGIVSILLISGGVALFITMIMHEFIPDTLATKCIDENDEMHKSSTESVKSEEAVILQDHQKLRLAILSTAIVMPLYVLFFVFNLTSSVLILIFVAMMALNPNMVAGIKGTKALLIGNTIGGLVALVFFQLLVAVPSFTFVLLGFLFLSLIFGKLIFSDKPIAPLFAMAFSTTVLLIASGTSSDTNSDMGFYQRILQIAIACGYIIFTVNLADMITKKLASKNYSPTKIDTQAIDAISVD